MESDYLNPWLHIYYSKHCEHANWLIVIDFCENNAVVNLISVGGVSCRFEFALSTSILVSPSLVLTGMAERVHDCKCGTELLSAARVRSYSYSTCHISCFNTFFSLRKVSLHPRGLQVHRTTVCTWMRYVLS